MQNPTNPWGARRGWKGAHHSPRRAWWQSAIKARQTALQLRRRAKQMRLLGYFDLLKDQVEQRARALDAVRSQLKRSIEDPDTPITPYGNEEPGYTLDEPYDIASVSDDPITSKDEEWSYDDDQGGLTVEVATKKPTKAAKKKAAKKTSKRKK